MKLALSVPSGFHAREVLMPLKDLLENDPDVSSVLVITPAAPYATKLFPGYSTKFEFIANPATQSKHDQLIRELRPDLVVTNTSGLDDKDVPLLRAAQTQKILTATFISSWDNIWKMDRSKQKQSLVMADHIFVWNTMMRDHVLRLFPELDPEQVIITGPPRFDFFHHTDRIPTKQQLYQHLELPYLEGQLIHFATTELYPMGYIIKTIHQQLSNKNLNLYASVHPGGNIAKHQSDAHRYKAVITYAFGRHAEAPLPDFLYHPTFEDIYMHIALFKHADLLINHSSTVALESFAGDTPVINVKYGQPFDWWNWYRSVVYRDFKQHYRDILADEPTRVVHNTKQLLIAASSYLKNPGQQHDARQINLKKMITTTDGTASQQLLNHFKRLINVS